MVPNKWRQINLKVTDEQLKLLKKASKQQGCDSVQALIRSRLEDVFSLVVGQMKAGNEGLRHIKLKELAVSWLKELGAKQIKIEVPTSLGHFVDVVGYFSKNRTIAVECGNAPKKRIREYQKEFTTVLHLPYSHTPEIVCFSKKSILGNLENKLIPKSTKKLIPKDEGETRKKEAVVPKTDREKEHRYHGCRDCGMNEVQVENCRIRKERYELYGQKCPREIELIKSGG